MLLPDPKSSDKSLRFVPCVGSEDEQIAKENAALLALLHLMPSLPLERKVHTPQRTSKRKVYQYYVKVYMYIYIGYIHIDYMYTETHL